MLDVTGNQSVETIIIGGGVIGLSVARSLARRGASAIMLIERGHLGSEASFAAAGMLAPQAEADANDHLFHLLCESRELYSDFAASLLEETGVDIELDTSGTLYLAFSSHDEEECLRRYGWQRHAQLEVEKLNSAEALEIEPGINPAVRLALRFPSDVQVENRRLVSALANSVNKLGVKISLETEVEAIILESGSISGLQTNRGMVRCSKVVVAAGCWSGLIQIEDRNFGRPSPEHHRFRSVPHEPVRGQIVCLGAKPQLFNHVIYSPRGYLVPRQDGRLLAGSTSEHAGYAKQVTAGGVSKVLRHAEEIAPQITNLPVIDSWAGLRPRVADGLPLLGRCDEIEGLFYATGHYRNGILLAPITGELLADVILNDTQNSKLAPFAPGRFSLLTMV